MAFFAAAGSGDTLEVSHRLAGFGMGGDCGQLAHPPSSTVGTVAVKKSGF